MAVRATRAAYSLLELIIVIAVLAVLLALVLAGVAKVREAANRVACLNNLRQLGLVVHAYHEDKSKLPPYSTGQDGEAIAGGWWLHLLSYAEQDNLYQRIRKLSEPHEFPDGKLYIEGVSARGVCDARFEILTCPSDPSIVSGGQGTTNYLANWYVLGDGVWGCYAPARKFSDIVDGLSSTVLFAEAYANCNGTTRPALIACCFHNFGITSQSKPSDDPVYLPDEYTMFQVQPAATGPHGCHRWRTQTAHEGMPVSLADGSCRVLAANIDPPLWKQLLKPQDGEPVSPEW